MGAGVEDRRAIALESGGRPCRFTPANAPAIGDVGTSGDAYHSPDIGSPVSNPTALAPSESSGKTRRCPRPPAISVIHDSASTPRPCNTNKAASVAARFTVRESAGTPSSDADPRRTKRSGPALRYPIEGSPVTFSKTGRNSAAPNQGLQKQNQRPGWISDTCISDSFIIAGSIVNLLLVSDSCSVSKMSALRCWRVGLCL